METIQGKVSLDLDLNGLNDHIKNYQRVLLDLGTGDGRYVRFLANQHPDWFLIGVDTCRENLCEASRRRLPNSLFVIASAQNLPQELYRLACHVTINFPWGSLLDSLLTSDEALLNGLASISKLNAQIDIHLNGGALAEAGTNLDVGTKTIHETMNRRGWNIKNPYLLDHHALRNFPTTWAKRLAYGRDPRAMALRQGLEAAGLSQERRSTRLRPGGLEWEWLDTDALKLTFELPPGTYATTLMTELGTVTDRLSESHDRH